MNAIHDVALQWVSARGTVPRTRALRSISSYVSPFGEDGKAGRARAQARRVLSDLVRSGHLEENDEGFAPCATTVWLPGSGRAGSAIVYGARSPILEERLQTHFGPAFETGTAHRSACLWRLRIADPEQVTPITRRVSRLDGTALLRALPSLNDLIETLDFTDGPPRYNLQEWDCGQMRLGPVQPRPRVNGPSVFREAAIGVRRWYLYDGRWWRNLSQSEHRVGAFWWLLRTRGQISAHYADSQLAIAPLYPPLPILVERALRIECNERLSVDNGALRSLDVQRTFYEEICRILGIKP